MNALDRDSAPIPVDGILAICERRVGPRRSGR